VGASITPGTTVRPSYLALWEDIARENQEKTRRLYEEGLGRGDLSSLKNTVSEDFRDLRHSERGEKGMERVVLRLRESFPDLVVSVDAQQADHDLVSTRLTISGTDRPLGAANLLNNI
jgi:predicted ester cyclase